MSELLHDVVARTTLLAGDGAPPASPWWPFLNALLNAAQAVAIAWLMYRDRRGRGD